MKDVLLKRLKEKKLEIERKKKDKSIFIKKENKNNKTIYHTKIMNDLYVFGIHKKKDNKFFIAFRELLDQEEKIRVINLFAVRDGDKFLGIFYGYRKPIQNIVGRHKKNVLMFAKIYYIEFRFKKGSVFCYLKGIARLLEKSKIDTKYYKFLFEKLINLESQVLRFYNKHLPDRSFIEIWVEKKLK